MATSQNLKIETVRLDEVFESPNNARVHGEQNVQAIADSLRDHGQVAPLVVRTTGEILAGNGTLKAMKKLGWESARIVRIEVTDDEAAVLSLRLNRTAELAQWDNEKLSAILKDLEGAGITLEELGWQPSDLKNLFAGLETDGPELPENYDGPEYGKSILITAEQREVFERAVEQMRKQEGEETISEGRVVELISINYLNDPNYQVDEAESAL